MALGVKATWLLTGSEPENLVKAQTRVELDALAVIRQIPLDHQAAAIAVLQGIAAAHKKK